jgi:signal transduction histidine kinase
MKRLGLGGRLLLFSSVLLAIPWLGYRYIGEMKEFLLDGQQEAQLLAARAVATVLHDRSDLFEPAASPLKPSLEGNALYVYPLETSIELDGYATDWGPLLARSKPYGEESTLFKRRDQLPVSPFFSLLLGERDGTIYGLLRVKDGQLVYRHPRYQRLDNSDQVRLALLSPDGRIGRFVLVTEGQGDISAYEVQENWQYPLTGQALFDLSGVWRERTDGYDLEFRLPADWLGPERRLLLSVVDVNDPDERAIDAIVGTLPTQWSGTFNRLILRSPELQRILQGLGRSDAGICVVDRYRRVRAVLGGQTFEGNLCADTDRIGQELVKEALVGQQKVMHRAGDSGTETLIVAAHPIYAGSEVVGAVLLEKNSAHILNLQRHTLTQLALATLLVLLLVVAGLLLFGTWLAFRIRRLKREAAAAIDVDGRVVKGILQSDQRAQDDLGDLSRGISDLLARLQRYTGFLETVPRTLRHEILNPVNTISMSLQRLAEASDAGTETAIRTAQQATRQLERIVNSLTEAAHIDGALKEDKPGVFDFAALLEEYVANASLLHPGGRLVYAGPPDSMRVQGSDLRIVQLLDKLKDNALDFSPAGGEIRFELQVRDKHAQLSILNEGPRIPEPVLQALFVGMGSHRPNTDGIPHLGIGLYIAKRIALHHGGELTVANRDDASGVGVTLRLPLVDIR